MTEQPVVLLRPSAAHRWMLCPGSVALEAGRPDEGREEAASGTLSHAMAAAVLRGDEPDAAAFVGRTMEADGCTFVVDEDRAERVQTYVDRLREYAALADEVRIEQPVDVSAFTAEAGAQGTPDAVVIVGDELQIHDLKDGFVRVAAAHNPQLMLYALGAAYAMATPVARARLVIHQPRIGHLDEWVCSIDELARFADEVETARKMVEIARKDRARGVPLDQFLRPGEAQCHYCRAKAVCPALAGHVEQAVLPGLEAIASGPAAPALSTDLSTALRAVPLVRMWCEAVEEEARRVMLAGGKIDGFKVVRGRKGARTWSNAEEAEKMLKSFRLNSDEMYVRKLISPTLAEERAQRLDKRTGAVKPGDERKPIKPRQWEKLQALIVQSEGALTIAPENDKRPAVDVQPVADHFQDETFADLLT